MNPEETFDDKQELGEIPEPSPNFEDQPMAQTEDGETKPDEEALTPEPEQLEEPQVQQKKGVKKAKEPISASEARTMATLAHLSVLLNLFTGFVGTIAALVIYIVYKDRSRLVAYHAMQAFIFQAITWFGAGILAVVLITFGSALFFLVIPLLCLIPGFLLLLAVPASLIYGVVGGVQVNNGEDFRYWLVGDWVSGILEPKTQS